MRLGDAIDFNPTEKLAKNTYAKKIGMDKLSPFYKYIDSFEYEKYSGGAKFKNGDTVVARITPCLENGKTAYIDLLDNDEIAFGSTEFIVMRNKENVTIPEYVYYLSISPRFREKAISLMTGTSGRQRVQLDPLKEEKFYISSIHNQIKMVKILSAIDEKIKLNSKINNNLYEISKQLLLKYLDENKSSDEINISKFLNIFTGKRNANETSSTGKYKFFSCAPESLLSDTYLCDSAAIIVAGNGAYTGRTRFYDGKFELYQRTYGLTLKDGFEKNTIYGLYVFMKTIFEPDKMGGTHGSAIPYIVLSDLTDYKIKYNKVEFDRFSNLVSGNIKMIQENGKSNEKLSELRNTLLPKLMNGEIDLDNIEI